MTKKLTFLFIVLANLLSAQVTIFPNGSSWKYLDNGTDQGTAWYGTTFNDGSWASGPGELGYGDGDEATIVGFGGNANAKYPTTYFRKTFTVASVSSYTAYTVSLKRDDGIILYINGVEVYRNNMPGTGVTYTTYASTNCADDGATIWTAVLPASVIVTGTNVIAAEIHQTNATSSDLTFELNLVGNTNFVIPSIVKGSYLQIGTQNSMIVRWETNVATDSKVMYGTSASTLASVATNTTSSVTHTVQLSGLNPYTKYYYNIGSSTLVAQGDTNNYFLTSPTPGTAGKYRFWVIGDCGNASTNQTNCKNQYKTYNGNTITNGWLTLGDNAYSNGSNAEFNAEFFNIYQNDVMKKMPLWPTPGNHDYNNGAATSTTVPYFSIFSTPANGEAGGIASGNPAYYSYDYGNVHFLSLDSYGTTGASQKMYDTTGAQVQWIKQDLAANTKKWTIAYWHHPPYTMGSHNSDTEGDLVNIRQRFIRILERNGVDLIMCGHSHDYERSKLMNGHYGNEASFNASTHHLSSSSGLYDGSSNSCPYKKDSVNSKTGTVYVLSGSAGQLGGQQTSFPHNAMYYSNASNGGSFILDIEANKLEGKWLCADGVIRDKFTIVKDVNASKTQTLLPAQTTTLSASWPGNYVWSNAATTMSVIASATSDATFWVRDPNNCLADTFKLKILPTANYTALPPFCASTPVQFNDLSTNNATAWSWSVNPSAGVSISSPTVQNPSFTFTSGGVFSITLISENIHGAGLPYTQTISVNTLPTLSVTASSTAICNGNTATLNVSGASTYTWSSIAVGASATVSPSASTGYSVTGTDVNGCVNFGSAFITVNQLPTVTAISSPTNAVICIGGSLTLSGSGATTYTWTGGISNAVSFAPSASGNYTVTGTDNNGCTNSAVRSVTVNALPSLTIQSIPASAIVCAGNGMTLTGTGANTYTWSNNIVNNSGFTPVGSAIYTLTATDVNGCKNSLTKAVTVNALPTLNVSGTNTVCTGLPTNLFVTGATTYTWNNNSNTSTLPVAPATTTTYTVNGTDLNNCVGTQTYVVTVHPLPTITVNNGVICPGYPFAITPGGATSYSFSSGSATVMPLVNSSYSVLGTSSAGCLSAIPAISSVSVSNLITVSITGNNIICLGQNAILTATGASNYNWSNGTLTASMSVSPSANTNYTVIGTTSTCSNSAVISIVVNPLPPVTISSTQSTICAGQTITLTAAGATAYNWNTGSNATSISSAPQSSTTFTVTGTDLNGCSKTSSQIISVNPLPVILTVSSNSLICVGETATLASTGANTYVWNANQNGNTLAVTPSVTTTYTVTGTDINNCSAMALITQSVSECTGIESRQMNSDLKVYPNPGNGVFYFEIGGENSAVISIFNALGAHILTEKLSGGVNTVKVEGSKGIYFYSINQGNQKIATGKLIKE